MMRSKKIVSLLKFAARSVDLILPRLNNVSQVALAIMAVVVYYTTVKPLYSVQMLENSAKIAQIKGFEAEGREKVVRAVVKNLSGRVGKLSHEKDELSNEKDRMTSEVEKSKAASEYYKKAADDYMHFANDEQTKNENIVRENESISRDNEILKESYQQLLKEIKSKKSENAELQRKIKESKLDLYNTYVGIEAQNIVNRIIMLASSKFLTYFQEEFGHFQDGSNAPTLDTPLQVIDAEVGRYKFYINSIKDEEMKNIQMAALAVVMEEVDRKKDVLNVKFDNMPLRYLAMDIFDIVNKNKNFFGGVKCDKMLEQISVYFHDKTPAIVNAKFEYLKPLYMLQVATINRIQHINR